MKLKTQKFPRRKKQIEAKREVLPRLELRSQERDDGVTSIKILRANQLHYRTQSCIGSVASYRGLYIILTDMGMGVGGLDWCVKWDGTR